tara:strand:+ start:2108 stop:2713 length:606 start_codon:yes stop_codon:yes gene_type:complete
MDNLNWISLTISFLGGGLAGAILNQFFYHRRNKIQPVGKSIELTSIFNAKENSLIDSRITITGDTKEYRFKNLWILKFDLINNGRNDYDKFNFGITLNDGIKAISVKETTKDRHHKVTYLGQPDFENQVESFDIELNPFNRKEIYTFEVQITSDRDDLTTDDIKLSTDKPVKFVDIKSKEELIKLLENVVVSFAGITVRIR